MWIEIITIAISAVASGLIATWITISYEKRNRKKQFQLSVVSDILAYKWQLTDKNAPGRNEISEAFGRVYIAFNGHDKVISSFNRLIEARKDNSSNAQAIFIEFLRTICKAVGMDLSNITDSQLTTVISAL